MDPVNRRRVIDLVSKLGREGRTGRGLEPHPPRGRGHDAPGAARAQRAHPRRGRRARDPRPDGRAPAHRGAPRPRPAARWPAAIVGWPNVLSVTFGAEGEWVTVQTARPDEFYGALPEAAARVGGRRDVLARREPRVGLQVPGGAMRDTLAGRVPVRRRRPRGGLRPRRSRGWCGRRRSLLHGRARVGCRSSFAPGLPRLLAGKSAVAADHGSGPLRPDRGRLLDPQRAARSSPSSTPPSLVADEVEGRTLTYLADPPDHAATSIFAGKFAAYLVTTLALALPASVLTFFVLLRPRAGWSADRRPRWATCFRDLGVGGR